MGVTGVEGCQYNVGHNSRGFYPMRYFLWTIGILIGAVVLLIVLFLTIAAINVIRTMRRYGDLTMMSVHGDGLRTFYRLVEEHFARQGKTVSIRDGVATVTATTDADKDADPKPNQLGLQNLSQLCAQIDEKEWPEVIAKHFDAFAASEQDEKRILAHIEDYEQIKQRLAVRIMPRYDQVPPETLVCREDLEGTFSTLVFDLPTTIRSVHADEEKRWPVGLSAVWATALENTKALTKPEIEEMDFGGVTVKAVTSEDSYVTTHALWLHEQPDWLGPRGALVAIPHRHALLVYPIRDMGVVMAIEKLAVVATGMEQEGPGSITANLYWFCDGKFVNLPYELKGRSLNFHPPNEFVEMLNTLEVPQTNP
jgi:hypothetical protein